LLGISLFRWGQYTRHDRIDLHLEVPTLPYAQLTDAAPAFRVTNRLSDNERAKLMGGTLERVYTWVPSKAS
jgi:hypothetical protein